MLPCPWRDGDQWRDYMTGHYDRHAAVPTTRHVMDFARYYLDERDNAKNTVAAKLGTLSRAFRYFQSEPAFPHPTDFNPFDAAKGKIDLNGDDPKDPRPIPLDELQDVVRDGIKHIRDRALIVTQFKLGLRASEASNIKLSEVHIANSELQDHYDDLGMHPALEGRPNAVYIPHDRKRNKSERPRVLPLTTNYAGSCFSTCCVARTTGVVAVSVEVGRAEVRPGQHQRRLEEALRAGVRPERTVSRGVVPLRATLLHDVV